MAVWLTGLPCAGKTTVAGLVAEALRLRDVPVRVLDGDVLRRSTSADLGFSDEDRCEQARRVALVAQEAMASGEIAVVAVVSPLARARDRAREVLGDALLEVHVDAPRDVCEARDVKGLYARARLGEVERFTGVSAPYEPPADPALRLPTAEEGPQASAERVVALLEARGAIPPA